MPKNVIIDQSQSLSHNILKSGVAFTKVLTNFLPSMALKGGLIARGIITFDGRFISLTHPEP